MGFLGNLFKGGAKVNVRLASSCCAKPSARCPPSTWPAIDDEGNRRPQDLIAKTAALEARFVGISKPREGKSRRSTPIVRTHGYGITTKGEQFLVMEFLDGPGLNSLVVGQRAAQGARMNSSGKRPRRRCRPPPGHSSHIARAISSRPRMPRRSS
jgi:hypothetical protein